MAALAGTSTTRRILAEPVKPSGWYPVVHVQRNVEWPRSYPKKPGTTPPRFEIEPYTPYLTAPNNWLPIVESRIRGSVLPNEYECEPSTEWLSEGAANAAIAFFRNGPDLLPTEPHIYGTKSGDLVAEFEAANGSMTSVVSDKQTILFAVLTGDREPIQTIIRRGSNRFRDELRSITRKLAAGSSHGKMGIHRVTPDQTSRLAVDCLTSPCSRALRGSPLFSGIQLYHFEETRDYEVSLDRLGATSPGFSVGART